MVKKKTSEQKSESEWLKVFSLGDSCYDVFIKFDKNSLLCGQFNPKEEDKTKWDCILYNKAYITYTGEKGKIDLRDATDYDAFIDNIAGPMALWINLPIDTDVQTVIRNVVDELWGGHPSFPPKIPIYAVGERNTVLVELRQWLRAKPLKSADSVQKIELQFSEAPQVRIDSKTGIITAKKKAIKALIKSEEDDWKHHCVVCEIGHFLQDGDIQLCAGSCSNYICRYCAKMEGNKWYCPMCFDELTQPQTIKTPLKDDAKGGLKRLYKIAEENFKKIPPLSSHELNTEFVLSVGDLTKDNALVTARVINRMEDILDLYILFKDFPPHHIPDDLIIVGKDQQYLVNLRALVPFLFELRTFAQGKGWNFAFLNQIKPHSNKYIQVIPSIKPIYEPFPSDQDFEINLSESLFNNDGKREYTMDWERILPCAVCKRILIRGEDEMWVCEDCGHVVCPACRIKDKEKEVPEHLYVQVKDRPTIGKMFFGFMNQAYENIQNSFGQVVWVLEDLRTAIAQRLSVNPKIVKVPLKDLAEIGGRMKTQLESDMVERGWASLNTLVQEMEIKTEFHLETDSKRSKSQKKHTKTRKSTQGKENLSLNTEFARVVWSVDDLKAVLEDQEFSPESLAKLTIDDLRTMAGRMEKQLHNDMVERGWASIDTLLDEPEIKPFWTKFTENLDKTSSIWGNIPSKKTTTAPVKSEPPKEPSSPKAEEPPSPYQEVKKKVQKAKVEVEDISNASLRFMGLPYSDKAREKICDGCGSEMDRTIVKDLPTEVWDCPECGRHEIGEVPEEYLKTDSRDIGSSISSIWGNPPSKIGGLDIVWAQPRLILLDLKVALAKKGNIDIDNFKIPQKKLQDLGSFMRQRVEAEMVAKGREVIDNILESPEIQAWGLTLSDDGLKKIAKTPTKKTEK